MPERGETKTGRADKRYINISYVENREVNQADIDKIHDIIQPDTVQEIAERSCHQNRPGYEHGIFPCGRHAPERIDTQAGKIKLVIVKKIFSILQNAECGTRFSDSEVPKRRESAKPGPDPLSEGQQGVS